MTAYYNEFDPYAAQWLRNLIAADRIAPGDVDERDLWDVTPDDLKGYTQVHFCAGIGIWSHALRSCGWEDNRPIWTASFPCQPFSEAGKGKGFADERHLWPAGYHLIRERQPAIVLGEQSASPLGRGWMELVQADLEVSGYAVGSVTTCAAGFGSTPGRGYHLRHRQYWCARRMGDAAVAGLEGRQGSAGGGREGPAWPAGVGGGMENTDVPARQRQRRAGRQGLREQETVRSSGTSMADAPRAAGGADAGLLCGSGVAGVAVPNGERRLRWTYDADEGRRVEVSGPGGEASAVDYADGVRGERAGGPRTGDRPSDASTTYGLADTHQQRESGRRVLGPTEGVREGDGATRERLAGLRATGESGVDLIYCADGKWRPVAVGTFPLAHEDSNRVGKLRAYGNALDAAQAQAFVAAVIGSGA